MFGTVGILVPLLQFVVMIYYQDRTLQNSSTLRFIKYNYFWCNFFSADIFHSMNLPIESASDLSDIALNSRTAEKRSFYEIRKLAVTCITLILMLLTFGVAYPPLAFIIFMSLVLQTLILQLCVRNHYMQLQHYPDLITVWNIVLEYEMRELTEILSGSRILAFLFSSCFISLFIIDMVTNVDRHLAIILPCVLISSTLCILIIYQVYEHMYPNNPNNPNESTDGVEKRMMKYIGMLDITNAVRKAHSSTAVPLTTRLVEKSPNTSTETVTTIVEEARNPMS